MQCSNQSTRASIIPIRVTFFNEYTIITMLAETYFRITTIRGHSSVTSQIASERYSNIIVTLAQTLDKRLPLTLVER